jgi:PKD repeat protein
VLFTDSSTGIITNWVWNFGDGVIVTNTSNANISHTYAAGTYTVSLAVSGIGGTGTSTKPNYIVVSSLVNTNAATANFMATNTGSSLQFTWAPDHKGWQLYTNAVGLSAAGSWFPVPGSASVTNETITINPSKPNVFFQLRYP